MIRHSRPLAASVVPLVFAVSVVATRAEAQPTPPKRALPRVHVIATGGTIASTRSDTGYGPTLGVDALLRAVPALDTIALLSTQQLVNIASSAMTPAIWLTLARHIADTLRARPDLAGVVVTHGTDTMEETAYFLDLTIADERPGILTGAMRPADGVGIDGPANLLQAVRVAASPTARRRGTMIVMNDEILAARDATKANTVRPDAFRVPYRGDLGVTDPEGIVFHHTAGRRAVIDVTGVRALARVDIVYSYAGADGADVDAFVAAGAGGLVVAATGRGNVPPLQRQALERARAKGIVVVIASRTGSGSVPVGEGIEAATGRSIPIGAGDLNAQKARVLLTLALTRTKSVGEIAAIFRAHQ